jgi:hypothetical protein
MFNVVWGNTPVEDDVLSKYTRAVLNPRSMKKAYEKAKTKAEDKKASLKVTKGFILCAKPRAKGYKTQSSEYAQYEQIQLELQGLLRHKRLRLLFCRLRENLEDGRTVTR